MDMSGPRQRRLTKPEESIETSAAQTKSSPCPVSPIWNSSDQAAGMRKHISISDSGLLAKFCCCMPGLILFPIMLTVVYTALFAQTVFFWITAALSVWTAVYSTSLSASAAIGAFRMRRDVGIDWHAKLTQLQEECPESSECMHIVLLPNYKEDEQMLMHTLKNLARSAMASQNLYVVLAMEEREGEVAREKAANLIDGSRHLFVDICATFHPVGLKGEIPGKSSNNQWAYRQLLQRLAPQLAKHDPSRIFITCLDADTLVHPQYFSAMTCQSMTMSSHERAWAIWQPPILLLRNLLSSPGPTRVSGYATILFELAGLANQKFAPHLCFSTYSFTLALASNHFVDGWDRDVIAEDHHMFCKCYFASIWDQLQARGKDPTGQLRSIAGDVKSSTQLHPVFLPAISYLVESDDGWFASIHARFVQARRHSQGLSELSYVLLQHMHLLASEKAHHIAPSAHMRILSIAGKMASVHIMASVHSFAFIMTLCLLVPGIVRWLLSHGVHEVIQILLTDGLQSLGGLKWAFFSIFGTVPFMELVMSVTTLIVVIDTFEGKLTADPAISNKVDSTELAAPDVQGSAKGSAGMGWWKRLQLYLMFKNDMWSGAFITMIAYGLLPASLAACSLMSKNGNGFNYIVGIKPNAS